jgi:iron-regulated transporter 1
VAGHGCHNKERSVLFHRELWTFNVKMTELVGTGAHAYKSRLPRRQIRDNSLPRCLPKAYDGRINLLLMHFSFAFVSRMWDMGIVLFFVEINNRSLLLAALCGILSSFSLFFIMPITADMVDGMDRLTATQLCLFAKIVFVTVACSICAYLTAHSTDSGSVLSISLFYILPLVCAVAGILFSTVTQSVEKEWIVVLSDGDLLWLSSTNAVMSQIDLGCAVIAPVVTGLLFEFLPLEIVVVVLVLINMVSTVCQLVFMRSLYWSWPALSFRPSCHPAVIAASPPDYPSDSDRGSHVCPSFRSRVKRYVADFLQSGCAGAMVSHALLFLTVLSFGSLLTAYVRWAGVSTLWIGVCRGLAALSGFGGAVSFPLVTSQVGLHQTAQIAIVYQWVMVVLAASAFLWTSSRESAAVVVIIAVVSMLDL